MRKINEEKTEVKRNNEDMKEQREDLKKSGKVNVKG